MGKNLETLCIHGGYKPVKGEPQQMPIIQSTTFKYDTSEQMARLFDLKDNGYFYTRLANPTGDTHTERPLPRGRSFVFCFPIFVI